MSLLRNEEDGFLKTMKYPSFLIVLWSRLHLFARKTEEKMSYKNLLCGNPQKISVHTNHYVTLDTFEHYRSRHTRR